MRVFCVFILYLKNKTFVNVKTVCVWFIFLLFKNKC